MKGNMINLRKSVLFLFLLIFNINASNLTKELQNKYCQYDYIIIGNGTAGATLARFLSDPVSGKFTNKVLVLEEGPNYSNDPAVLDGSYPNVRNLFTDPKYSLPQLVSGVNPPLGGIRGDTDFSYGRMWGGSSAHLHLFAVRGTADIYDQWAAISGNPIWSFNNLLPLMKFMEKYIPNGTIPDSTRGLNGFLPITQNPEVVTNIFAQAIVKATGTPFVPDYNADNVQVGVSALQEWNEIVNGIPIRTFSSRSFLSNNIVSPEGFGVNGRQLRILSPAQMQKIIFDSNNKAIGVEYILNSQSQKAYATKKVILCAGALSCAILQRSGIGPAQLLKSLSIPVVVDSPNVGQNLENHYGVTGAFLVDPSIEIPPRIMAFVDGKPYLPGPAGVRRIEIIISYPPQLNSKIVSASGLSNIINVTGQKLVTISAYNLRVRSRGSIFVPDNDPLNLARINFNFYSDGDLTDPNSDASVAVAMWKIIRDIANNVGPGVTLAYPPANDYVLPCDPISTAQCPLFRDAQDSSLILHHYVGTCAMGTNISNGVVNSLLEVFGVNGLMVADNSIAPISETGNTAYQAYLIALVAAKILGVNLP